MLLQHTQENLVKDGVLKQLWVAGLCTFDMDHILSLNYLGQSSESAISEKRNMFFLYISDIEGYFVILHCI